ARPGGAASERYARDRATASIGFTRLLPVTILCRCTARHGLEPPCIAWDRTQRRLQISYAANARFLIPRMVLTKNSRWALSCTDCGTGSGTRGFALALYVTRVSLPSGEPSSWNVPSSSVVDACKVLKDILCCAGSRMNSIVNSCRGKLSNCT